MSTQYNNIQAPFDELKKTTASRIERVNIREIVLPLCHNARVLDLACGSGRFTQCFLDWGAEKVVGVDISSAMLQQARRLYGSESKINYIEADCSEPVAYDGGPFDLVFASWLLNYAATKEEMVKMYQTIALNLKDGGRFIAVTVPPTDRPEEWIERESSIRPFPMGSGGLVFSINGKVKDGMFYHLHADTPVGDVDFDSYYLHKGVYEAAARDGGLHGELKWITCDVPEDFMENPSKYGEEDNGGADTDEVETYKKVPHCAFLEIVK